MKYRDILILVAAFAVGAMGAAVEQRVTKAKSVVTSIIIDRAETYGEYGAERDSWWNPAWGQNSTGDLWIIGNHTYTTRDLMGRGA